jgi:hypothetical protein
VETQTIYWALYCSGVAGFAVRHETPNKTPIARGRERITSELAFNARSSEAHMALSMPENSSIKTD